MSSPHMNYMRTTLLFLHVLEIHIETDIIYELHGSDGDNHDKEKETSLCDIQLRKAPVFIHFLQKIYNSLTFSFLFLRSPRHKNI